MKLFSGESVNSLGIIKGRKKMTENVKYPLIGELFELRKKEVLEGLTYEEMRRISMVSDEIDKTLAKRK